MSRQFKFRSWDKESEIMIYSDKRNSKEYDMSYDFTTNESGSMVCNWFYDYDDSMGYSKTNSGKIDNIMQFTGLHDKNGVEIYEDDIVIKKPFKKPFIVYFDINEGGFCCKAIDGKNDMEIGYSVACDCEVIGNIHTKP